MFLVEISDRHLIRLLEISDAEELFVLTDENRDYLRQWLPWLDSVKKFSDTLHFIESSRQQFINERAAMPPRL